MAETRVGAPRRWRSSSVALPAVTFVAAGLLAACSSGSQVSKDCVDSHQNVIASQQCAPGGSGQYYFHSGSSSFPIGTHLTGGGFSESAAGAGARAASAKAAAARVGRGGFGGHGGSE